MFLQSWFAPTHPHCAFHANIDRDPCVVRVSVINRDPCAVAPSFFFFFFSLFSLPKTPLSVIPLSHMMEPSKHHQRHQNKTKKKWFLPLILSLLISTFLILLSVIVSSNSPSQRWHHHHRAPVPKEVVPRFVESKLKISPKPNTCNNF